jgi:hypothetical protein
MTDEEFWHLVRRGLLGMAAAAENVTMRREILVIVSAIEKRYGPESSQKSLGASIPSEMIRTR